MTVLPLRRAEEAIPVTLLTGFLGSGKTTLLNQLLADPRGVRAAVLINEFGEVGLDHLLARPVQGTKVVVKNGCVCCTVHEDLRQTLRTLLNARAAGEVPAFDRLLIETSGVTDPMPVILTLHGDPMFRHRLRLETIVTTVDALNGLDQLQSRPVAARQAAMADRIVLTKTDLQTPEAVAVLKSALHAMTPGADLLRVPSEASLWEMLTTPRRSGFEAPAGGFRAAPAPLHDDGTGLQSFSLVLEERPDWSRFAVWLSLMMHRHGPKLLRIKGLLSVAGQDGPMLLHAVQNFIHPPDHLAAWPDEDRRSRLVFIMDGLEEEPVRAALSRVLGVNVTTLPDRQIKKSKQG